MDSRRPRRLRWLLLMTLLVSSYAAGAKWDVKDTHDRLDKIYDKLGIKKEEAAQQGCNRGEEKTEDKDQGCNCNKDRKESKSRSPSFKTPTMPAWLGYVLIGIIVAAMLIPLAMVLRNSYRNSADSSQVLMEDPDDEPGEAAPTRGPWRVDLSECRRLIQEGKVSAAFASLHRLTLLGLQRGHQLTLDDTTTNWEYVRRLSSKPPLKEALSAVTLAAERSVLGQDPPGVDRYEVLERLVRDRVREEPA